MRDNEPLRKKLKPLTSTQKPTDLRCSHLFEERKKERKKERKERRKEGRKEERKSVTLFTPAIQAQVECRTQTLNHEKAS